MGKKGHASGMLICLLLSILSFSLSSTINSFFDIEIDSGNTDDKPLVGLENNESWLVVLVDFASDPLEDNEKQVWFKSGQRSVVNHLIKEKQVQEEK